jgi:hypothetical protein
MRPQFGTDPAARRRAPPGAEPLSTLRCASTRVDIRVGLVARVAVHSFILTERTAPAPRVRVEFRGWLGKIALSLASLIAFGLAILGAEWGARRWEPDYLVRSRGLHVYSPTYGWTGRPGTVAPMGEGRVTLNSRGYRGLETWDADRGASTRVVVLGDSVAFGYGVSDEQAFPDLLRTRDNGLAVVSLAVAGYGPGQELLVLKREVPALKPDVVLLAVCLRNDFVDAVLAVALYDGVAPRPRFRLEGEKLVLDESAMPHSFLGRSQRRLADSSHLFNRLLMLLPHGEAQDPHDWRYRKQEVLEDPDYAFRLTLALVLEMETLCRQGGSRLLVASFPSGLSYDRKNELPTRFMQALDERGVWTLDMSSRFRELGLPPEQMALDRTGHLSPKGHLIASEILEREIDSRRPRL